MYDFLFFAVRTTMLGQNGGVGGGFFRWCGLLALE